MIRMLVLEPQEILRVGFGAIFSQEQDIEIIAFCAAVDEAIDALSSLQPNLVLLDDCSDKSLLTAAARLQIGSIVFSSSSDGADVLDAMSSGASAYVLKGTSVALLVNAVRAVNAGASWLDPVVAKKAMSAVSSSGQQSIFSGRKVGGLSARECEVLALVCDGHSNTAIGRSLLISCETVKTHVRHIMEKLQVRTRTEAAIEAVKLGFRTDY